MRQNHKGMIALDIDGTVTDELLHVPAVVVEYLEQLTGNGWEISFFTGRTLSFAKPVLSHFQFPYLVAIQNGADILKMPEKKRLARHYIDHALLIEIDKACSGQKEDFVIYAGYEKGDFCYYRPDKCSKALLDYFEQLQRLCDEPWKAVSDFAFDETVSFPLIKCFGDEQEMRALNTRLSELPSIHATMIRDPVDRSLYLNLITHHQATKGEALKWIKQHVAKHPIIAAGDDRNDIALFKNADICIVMETAPSEVLAYADIIAKPAAECGLIEALEEATRLSS